MRKISILTCSFLIIVMLIFTINWFYSYTAPQPISLKQPERKTFEFQSIDTMKYSRDLSREKNNDPEFEKVIDTQIKNIADIGATHVAIGTPYDEEFLPFLKTWVNSARAHGLKVWFRGNWSGWEQWFSYPSISREQHLEKTRDFIISNPDLFEDGDAFSACPECENGGPGDPRMTGDVDGYRNFLISEYEMMESAFYEIHKDVKINLFSSNGDVAKLIMDKDTTRATGGTVTIDHYVNSTSKLVADLDDLAASSGGKIFLGEFGAPIPDIQGNMTDEQQAMWIEDVVRKLRENKNVAGINYWLNVGGSTALWTVEGQPKQAVGRLEKYFKPNVIYGTVKDSRGKRIENVSVNYGEKNVFSDRNGYFQIAVIEDFPIAITFSKENYILQYGVYDPKASRPVEIIMESKDGIIRFSIEKIKKIFLAPGILHKNIFEINPFSRA